MLKTCKAARTVVAVKRSLDGKFWISRIFENSLPYIASPKRKKKERNNKEKPSTYHSKAPNTMAAVTVLQMRIPWQLPGILSSLYTAKAMKPANQNNMVKASRARMANLLAKRSKKLGARARYGSTSKVQTDTKTRKLTSDGTSPSNALSLNQLAAAQSGRHVWLVKGRCVPYGSMRWDWRGIRTYNSH